MHDLENKKRKAIADFKKENLILKFFMKVNVYDQENVQKGKLMLLNLAEDLKEHAKMKVSPSGKKADAKEDSKKKASPDIDQVKEAADAQAFVKLDKSSSGNIDEDDLEDDSFDADSR